MGPERGREKEGAQLCQGMSRDGADLLMKGVKREMPCWSSISGRLNFRRSVNEMTKE